jgi:hypothetical protein
MKPGDLIEWVHEYDSQHVHKDAKLWSTPMQRWVPIGVHPMMLISITDEFYFWLTLEGLLLARVDDASSRLTVGTRYWVVPRIIGEHR